MQTVKEIIFNKLTEKNSVACVLYSSFYDVFLAVLRSMVTATAFQILVSNNAPIKAITDNAIVTLEVSVIT